MSFSFTVSSNQIINFHASRSGVGSMYCGDGFYGKHWQGIWRPARRPVLPGSGRAGVPAGHLPDERLSSTIGQHPIAHHKIPRNGGFAMLMRESGFSGNPQKALTIIVTLLLLNTPAFVGAQDKNEAFMHAAVEGDLKKVETLLNDGVDVNAEGKERKRTALMWAAQRGHLEVVVLLLKKGADINAKDENGETALLSASGRGGLEVVKLLLKNGADVNRKDKNDRTALMLPSWTGHVEVVKLLVAKGMDVNAKDKNGRTALMWASEQGHTPIVELLKAHGAKE